MWRLKGCPRCLGDMVIEQDYSGWYELCIQCGYRGHLRHPKQRIATTSLKSQGTKD